MITVKVNHKDETVTYSTLVNVDGKLLSLRVTKYLYYAKPHQLNHKLPLPLDLQEKKITLFEDLFYWSLEFYTSAKRNHVVYNNLVESDFNKQSKKAYEVNWEIIHVKFDPKNKNVLLISNNKDFVHKDTMYMAIPPNTPGQQRYDYVTDNGMLYYNTKQGEHQGIEIFYDGKQKIFNW